MLELANRRVRSADDLVEVIEVPVLETIPSASSLPPTRRFSNKFPHRKHPDQRLGPKLPEPSIGTGL